MDALLFIIVLLVVLSLAIWAIELMPLPPVPKRLAEVLAVVITAIFILHRYVPAFG